MAVQSAFILTTRAFVREIGRYEEYTSRLSLSARAALDCVPSGVWIPVDIARAHLEAVEALALSDEQTFALGARGALRLHNPLIRFALRLAGAAQSSPLLLATKAVKLWPERNDGGDLLIVQTGPNTARVELLGYPFADFRHIREVWRGVLQSNAKPPIGGLHASFIRCSGNPSASSAKADPGCIWPSGPPVAPRSPAGAELSMRREARTSRRPRAIVVPENVIRGWNSGEVTHV